MMTDRGRRARGIAVRHRRAAGPALVAAAAVLVAAGGTGSGAGAMSIKKVEGGQAGVETILLEGKIETGDALALQGYIAKLPVGARIVVHLDSTGGSVREAIATGRVIHKNKIRTVVPSKAACTSACITIFVGGRDWETGRPWQLAYSTARLGVHSFRREYPDKVYTSVDMSRGVAETLKAVLSYTEYWDEVGADYELLYLKWATSNREMTYIPSERLLELGIQVLDERSGEIIDPKAVRERLAR
jgi:hypothetical protein